MRAWALGCFYSHISTQTVRRALTASVDSCAEIKSTTSVAYVSLDKGAEKVCSESDQYSSHRFPALPPNSARFSYATEGALFISAQLSGTDAVSALRKVMVLARL